MMRTRRFYKITKTLLSYGLDDLIPAGWLPLDYPFRPPCFFWLPNKHKDKPAGVRLRLALEELGPVWSQVRANALNPPRLITA